MHQRSVFFSVSEVAIDTLECCDEHIAVTTFDEDYRFGRMGVRAEVFGFVGTLSKALLFVKRPQLGAGGAPTIAFPKR